MSAATREPHRSLELIAGLLAEFRAHGFFDSVDHGSPNDGDPNTDPDLKIKVDRLRASFLRVDWELTPEGEIRPAGVGTVQSLDGRPAIDVQLARLRRAADDPSLLLGTAKEMLESTGKYVTEQFSVPLRPNTTFDELWHHARERLDLLPQQVNVSAAGGKQVREILQSSWSIAQMTNQIRNDEGTGHGRTLPTAVTPEIAMMVVREACSVAEMVLSKLDRAIGRQR